VCAPVECLWRRCGPSTVWYDGPRTLQLHAEALLAGNACIELRKVLVVGLGVDDPRSEPGNRGMKVLDNQGEVDIVGAMVGADVVS